MGQLLNNIRRHSQSEGAEGAAIYDFPTLLEKHKDAIERALPRHLPVERIMRVALTAFRKNESLAKCQPISVVAAVVQASQLGLELHQNGEAFLVPFEGECQLVPGYKGLMKLARNSGLVRDLFAHEVRINDYFDYDLGAARRLVHKPLAGEGNFPAPEASRGKVVGYYAVALLGDGTPTFVMKHQLDVDAIRDGTRGYQSAVRKGRMTPWDTHPVAMGKKTLIRLLCNSQLPLSADMQLALQLDKADMMGVKQGIKLEQAADGHYEPPTFEDLPPLEEDDHRGAPHAPPPRGSAPQQNGSRSESRGESDRPSPPGASHPPVSRPSGYSRPAAVPPSPRPAPQRAPSQAPVKPAAQNPSQDAATQQNQDRARARADTQLDADLAAIRRCTNMAELDELAMRLEASYSGAPFERITRAYDEMRKQLNSEIGDLFRGR